MRGRRRSGRSTPGSGAGLYWSGSMPLGMTRHLPVGDAVEGPHVVAHRAGHGDHPVGVLVGGAFHPGADVVAAAELLGLPRAVRLERVGGEHQGGPGQLADQAPGQVGVPGVAVDHVGLGQGRGHDQVADERVHELAVPRVAAGDGAPLRDAPHRQVAVPAGLVAEAEDLDGVGAAVEPGQLAGQVLDVDAGAAVDVRRVLVGENGDAHDAPPATRRGPAGPEPGGGANAVPGRVRAGQAVAPGGREASRDIGTGTPKFGSFARVGHIARGVPDRRATSYRGREWSQC